MTLLPARVVAVSVLAAVALLGAQAVEPTSFQGEEIEEFLANANVIDMKGTDVGVTLPRKATLERNSVTHFAIFKTIDKSTTGQTNPAVEVNFQDSWKTEIAAYELDRMIGLRMVPATVERRLSFLDRGSMQWWINDSMSEKDRLTQRIPPPDVEAWNDQMYKMRLFDNLIYNVDRNAGNLLITEDWEVFLIDHSRSFRLTKELRQPTSMLKFPRSVLDNLKKLDEETMKERLGDYLTIFQIRAVLARRDLILEKAAARIAEVGEDRALFN